MNSLKNALKENRTYPLVKFIGVILSIFLIMVSCKTPDLQTVPYVDLEKYSGLWYEIASFPQRFQKGCHGTTATYTMSDKGYVIVENRCFKDSLDGEESYIKGKAFVKEGSGNAKLKVQFFWPFKGKYWIIDLADDYSYAVVGHPNREYLWILSRTPNMEQETYNEIVKKVSALGFDINQLKTTVQP